MVGDQPVGFAIHPQRHLGVGRLDQAEHLSALLVHLLRELERAGNIDVRLHTVVTEVHGAGQLEALTVRDGATNPTETLPTGALFILIGAEPHTNWPARRSSTMSGVPADQPRPPP